MNISPEANEMVKSLQQMQQQVQILMYQKQNLQIQLTEIGNAIKETKDTEENEVYEIVGNIMIKKNRQDLLKSLKEKKELLDLRLTSIDKQLDKISEESKKIQDKIVKLTEKKGK